MSGDAMKPADPGVKLTYDDFLLLPARARDVMTDKDVRSTPELVIEIGSPGTLRRDETIKRSLYERVGVFEYWIVDPKRDAINVHRRTADAFQQLTDLTLAAGDVLTTPVPPDLQLQLSAIFKDHQAIT